MVVRKQIQEVTSEEVAVWHLVGWLGGTLERKRKITIDDWNQAVEAAKRAKIRDDKQREEIDAKIRAERGLE
jgi:hypothetical protein